MNVIYVSSTCSAEKYTQYIESKGARISQQAQKYNLLLAEGMAENGAQVRMISTRPINRTVAKQLWFKGEKEQAGAISFSYIPFVNYPVLRNLFILWGVFFKVLLAKGSRKNTAVVCDGLNIMASLAALMAAGLRGFPTVGIVTDVPCHLSNMKKIPFSQKLNLWVMRKFKSYLLLTQPMTEIVNPKNRPYIVLEGHSDSTMAAVENNLADKNKKKLCLYAGSLKKIYGIKALVEGFVAAAVPETELHVYGSGDYAKELEALAQQQSNVKYLGVVPNSVIVRAELEATLLINPRPTNEEYTKYSFPSKNMEYMASGTPVLTTRLPGMPADHIPYVYFIEQETSEGIAEALKKVLSQSPQQLHSFGMKAKEFVLTEKSNFAQADKVLRFISGSFGLEDRESVTNDNAPR